MAPSFGFRKATEAGMDSPPADDDIGQATSVDTGVEQLKKFKKTHQWDYNLDYDTIENVNKVADSEDVEKKANFEHTLLEEDSPYFEVRTSVRNYDE
jgi:hypothetical protein